MQLTGNFKILIITNKSEVITVTLRGQKPISNYSELILLFYSFNFTYVISLGTLQEGGWIVGVEINVTFCGN